MTGHSGVCTDWSLLILWCQPQ